MNGNIINKLKVTLLFDRIWAIGEGGNLTAQDFVDIRQGKDTYNQIYYLLTNQNED